MQQNKLVNFLKDARVNNVEREDIGHEKKIRNEHAHSGGKTGRIARDRFQGIEQQSADLGSDTEPHHRCGKTDETAAEQKKCRDPDGMRGRFCV